MKKILLLFLFFTLNVNAEIITAKGKHKHIGDKTKIQSCKIAEEKAKKNAIVESLGQTISSDVISNCSEIDGEYDCERNQFSLFELNGDITSYKIINKKYDKEIFQWLPYGGTHYKTVTKIFPNKKNTNNLITNNLTIPFDVYFPDKINQNSVDEYLVFVASEEDIPWLEEYSQIEGLKSQISKSKILMEKDYIGYIVIN